jgi:hypothetical protein
MTGSSTSKRQRKTRPDPSIAALVDQLQKSQARRRKQPARATPEEKRAAERQRQARRNRVMYDLPPEVVAQIKALAREHQVPESQIAALLLWAALEKGLVDFDDYKVYSQSPRYKYNLRIPSAKAKKRE